MTAELASARDAQSTSKATQRSGAEQRERRAQRDRWLLSLPALLIIGFAAAGPMFIVLVYSFTTPGDYTGIKWIFSTEAWVGVILQRDIFDDTLAFADAHMVIFWRSLKLISS